ncbi:30S ribosomal protein S6 [Candidatus Woesebacteria bacterium GWB1_43_5]|uniref:Small ribosomal subunit protein bS6 n=1 Tax=Candidatus Woesebacteria bacterium GWB1_43_5 TaxID=1802474 RepID=A0A1F7WSI3_9BACT|nr:MAG: 30S ribosomal protein S6 [Candidatus Woesebacteria bacterium GWB1_43_5]
MNYELTLVLRGDATPAKRKSTADFVEKLVKTFKGSIKKTEDWGKVDLAYEVAKNNSGIFLHFVLELDPAGAKALGEKIRMEEGIIRHLMVRKEKSASA